MIYRGMDQTMLDAAYNIGAAMGAERRQKYFDGWAAQTAALATPAPPVRDLRYGDAARNRIDFYPCGKAAAPTLLFIHGGYWQATDKEMYGFLAAGPLARGLNVALIEYTLAPAIRIEGIVAEVRRGLGFLVDHLPSLGAAPGRIVLAGHSAGGHLAAMSMAEPGVVGCLAFSGLYELEPIRLAYLNEALHLDEPEVERMSPIRHIPATAPAIVVGVGGDELPEFLRQAADYHAALSTRGLPSRHAVLEAHDHFSILDELARPDGALTEFVMELLG